MFYQQFPLCVMQELGVWLGGFSRILGRDVQGTEGKACEAVGALVFTTRRS